MTLPNTKAEYRYNGLGQRVAYKLNGTGTWYDLVQDEQWREVAVYDRTNSKFLERTLFHNAGLNGRGGSSYIDSCALRETSPTTGTYPVMQTRWYTLQNWRADVVATLASTGKLTAWSSYTAYGKQDTWRLCDIDDGSGSGVPDGGVTIDDFLLYQAWFEAGDPRADVDDGNGLGVPDAGVTIDDLLFYNDMFEGSGGDYDSRLGYAGYVKDEADSGQSGLYHVRYRGYSTELGNWLTEDPLKYVDGTNLYEYISSHALIAIDPAGLGKICTRQLDLPNIIIVPVRIPIVTPTFPPMIIPYPGNSPIVIPGITPGVPPVVLPPEFLIPIPLLPGITPGVILPDILKRTTLYPEHKQVVFEDGKSPPDIGYFSPGVVRPENPGAPGYTSCITGLDDDVLRAASRFCSMQSDYTKPGGYNLFTNNCRDFTDCVLDRYYLLKEQSRPSYGYSRPCLVDQRDIIL